MWTKGEHASCVKRMDLCSMNRTLPRVEEPFAPLRKDSILKCLVFWQLGESQTLYKMGMCVPDLNLLPWNMKSSHNWTRTCIFSFHNPWCMWVEFVSALECEVLLWAVCSVSPCLTWSVCSDSFVVGWRDCSSNSAEIWFIYRHAHSYYSWSLIMKTVEFILTDIISVYIQWICMGKWRAVEYYDKYTA
jgi:hypothetical protein